MKYTPTITQDPLVMKEHNPTLSSVHLSVRIPMGSCHDPEGMLGLSHYLEHLVFKSTQRFPGLNEVMKYAESLGASLNAHTTNDHTLFYIIGPTAKFEELASILSEVVLRSTFTEEHVQTERDIILQEYATTLDDQWHTKLILPSNQTRYNNTEVYNNIIGDTETINAIDYATLRSVYDKYYVKGDYFINASGNIGDESVFCGIIPKYFNHDFDGTPVHKHPDVETPPAIYGNHYSAVGLSEDNAKVWINFEDLTVANVKDFHILQVINEYLGAGVNSRLWSVIREEHALAYQIGSGFGYPSYTPSIGSLYVYSETSPDNVDKLVDLVLSEFNILNTEGISQERFDAIVARVLGAQAVQSDTRPYHLEEMEMQFKCFGQFYTDAQMLEELQKITLEDVNNMCMKFDVSKYNKGVLYPNTH